MTISNSIFHQIIKNWIFLKSTRNGLLKNVQYGISRPLGSREIQKTKVANVLRDTLYSRVMENRRTTNRKVTLLRLPPLKRPHGGMTEDNLETPYNKLTVTNTRTEKATKRGTSSHSNQKWYQHYNKNNNNNNSNFKSCGRDIILISLFQNDFYYNLLQG